MATASKIPLFSCAHGDALQRCEAALADKVVQLNRALLEVEASRQRAAGAAHDIRNALVVVLGEADFLTCSLDDPEQREAARAVAAAGHIIRSLTRDLLESARPSQRPPLEVDSSALMASCQPLMARMLNQSGAACVFAVEPALWPVVAEPQQLEAALLNLVANARDAVASGGGVRVAARNVCKGVPFPAGLSRELPAGDYVAFVVEDTGMGMCAKVLARATEAYFTTKDVGRGTGLGLSRVQAFAAEAGGTLQIRSEPGYGTHVQILLPRAPALTEPSGPRHKQPEALSSNNLSSNSLSISSLSSGNLSSNNLSSGNLSSGNLSSNNLSSSATSGHPLSMDSGQ